MHKTIRTSGVTLVELMIVVAIIGIMAALAWPSYTRPLIRMRRVEGQAALIEAMQQQDRFQSQHNRYAAFSSTDSEGDAEGFKWWSGRDAPSSAYELDAYACPDSTLAACVEIRARPGTGKVDARFRDPDCGTLTLDSQGRQGAQTAPGSSVRCWP
jgi:type IV pilus assembly protein PilE